MFVQMECLVIRIKEVAILVASQVNVMAMKIALIHWHAFKEHVLAHAKVYYADKMPTVSLKTMQRGVDAVLVLLKMKMANVYHVS